MTRMLGCKMSKLDGTERKITKNLTNKVPTKYSFQDYMPAVTDQGTTSMCVAHAIAGFLNWVTDMKLKTSRKDNKVDIDEIYSMREDKKHDSGMTIKEALSYVKRHGVKSGSGLLKISDYAMVGSEQILKQAILCNGPCLMALPVYDITRDDFWNGTELEGGHCVAVVGYDEEGFIIRNSWGTSYGSHGYGKLPYSDFNKVRECWTII